MTDMTDKQKVAMQEHYINEVFTALANNDENACWSAVHGLADLREERPDAVLFKLYKGLNQDNWKLIEAQKELAMNIENIGENIVEINDAVTHIIGAIQELKQAEDMNDWQKVEICAQSIQRQGETISKMAEEFR